MELTINALIKMILGIMVFVAVIGGFYFFFRNQVTNLFGDINVEAPAKMILSILK